MRQTLRVLSSYQHIMDSYMEEKKTNDNEVVGKMNRGESSLASVSLHSK